VAENENGQEKTEEATPKRLEKSKEDGSVARSKELTTTFVLFGGVIGLASLGSDIGTTLLTLMRFNFTLTREVILDERMMISHLGDTAFTAFEALIPLFSILVAAAMLGPIALGGWLFSIKALAPKMNKMDPAKGLKRMFSANSLMELVKAMAKFGFVASVAVLMLYNFQHSLVALAQSPLKTAISDMFTIIGWSVLAVCSPMIVISMIDIPFQIFEHKKKLKMTLQEVKEEFRDSEGKPEVKSKVRQLQFEMAQRRMMEAVPEADVVITNPEHFSVALKYDVNGSGAPIVIAKGIDFMAIKIREIAKAHDVMILQSPPLARAIYFTTEPDQEIPNALYLAVAQVLAYVFQLRAHKEGTTKKPKPLGAIEVPLTSQYDTSGKPVTNSKPQS